MKNNKNYGIISLFVLTIVLECQSIYKGKSVDIAAAPFMLSFHLNDDHVCGAAVISPDWAVTAAHCVWSSIDSNDTLAVRSGSSQTDSGGILHNITKGICHPKYNDDNKDYDIAVLMVDPSFEMSDTTDAIELPSADGKNLKIKWANVLGWGKAPEKTSGEDVPVSKLRYAKVPRIKRSLCSYDYDPTYVLTPRQICYGYREGGPDTCQGDSGGPLYNEDHILLGVTSWGDDCRAKYTPGVYQNIIPVREWIRNVTNV